MCNWKSPILLLSLLACMFVTGRAQHQAAKSTPGLQADKPKLIVGIVVDQLRYDYLPRYWNKFGDGGFKRFIHEGFNFKNNHFSYFPTYTGPGHAAVYTGTTPSVNGIVGNAWYDRSIGDDMYVVSDSTISPVGTDNEAGKMSPANLLSTTVTDALKNANEESKVVAVSIKDRAAVLPGGHLADGAYWFEAVSGKFISSSWYVDALPEWVQDFNESGIADELRNQTWDTLLPIEQYIESNADDSPYEGTFSKKDRPVFPYKLSQYSDDDSYAVIPASPFGNTLITAFARKALNAENLGADEITDFLGISFSSTDYVGHRFGPHSIELQDTYLRLDRELAGLFSYLDQKVGKGDYTVMLTSDHGAVDVPAELMDKKLPGGYFNSGNVMKVLKQYLNTKYGHKEWIERYVNQQIYLNHDLIAREELVLKDMQQDIATFLLRFDAVKSTNTAYNLQFNNYSNGQQAMYQRGFLYDRSGDVYIQLKPGWLDSTSHKGTSHGSVYTYDTHVPLLFYGWNIPHGETSRKTYIHQIAPTISLMLDIPLPSGSSANALQFKE